MRRAVLLLAAALVAISLGGWLVAGRSHSVPSQPAGRATPAQDAAAPALVATRFLTALSLAVVENARRRQEVIARFAAPANRRELEDQYAAEAERVETSFAARPRVSRTGLLGFRQQRAGANSARVDVWAVSLGAAGHAPVAVGWQVIRVTLARTRGVWRVARVEEKPAPDVGADGTTFAAATAGFKEYHVAP